MVLKSKIGKKGIIFTIIAIVISAIIISAFFFTQTTPLNAGVSSVKVRINNIITYLNQIETYLNYQAGAQTNLAIRNMTQEMINRNRYYHNNPNPDFFDRRLKDCLKEGTARFIGGGPQQIHNCNANLTKIMDDLEHLSLKELNINIEFEITDIAVYHSSPWHITTEVNVTIEVNDSYAYWNINKTLKGNTSIIGMKDPTHNNKTAPSVVPTERTITTQIPFNGWSRYPSTLNEYKDSVLYFTYEGAPSFLDRLNNNINNANANYGIASIINQLGPDGSTVSQLDFRFLRGTSCGVGERTIKFDFYRANMNNTERALLGISEIPANTINDFIFPYDFVQQANMSNSNYYEFICS